MGGDNYREFFVLISSVTVFLALHLSVGLVLVVQWARNVDWAGQKVFSALLFSTREGMLVMVIITMTVVLVLLCLIGELLKFHIRLGRVAAPWAFPCPSSRATRGPLL